MSTVVSLRLKDEQIERLRRVARASGQTPSKVGAMLIEEGLRMAEFPYIEFRNSPIIRQAYIKGSRITPWFLEILARAYDRDVERIAAHLSWPTHKVQGGLAYVEAFRDEIESAIAENESQEKEQFRRAAAQGLVFRVGESQAGEGADMGAA